MCNKKALGWAFFRVSKTCLTSIFDSDTICIYKGVVRCQITYIVAYTSQHLDFTEM